MSLVEGEAFANLYEQYGVKTSSDAGVSILAGSTLGGGTRVNWCASLRTPSHVLKVDQDIIYILKCAHQGSHRIVLIILPRGRYSLKLRLV